ncbi:hypothetical protein Ga0609869_000502 [Rhodovulum iodosum]|uniref:Dihydroorotate dehydrogenase n=1 Tax=Rhodovulum iodosum TaxID=68291 RepID=A0ABV3XPL4_9RHOB|nr:dihydroorotate dehydrogenase [Rhodovulum robiginosum]RSK31550.1 dihydroorotate dehydrogenase [Rhodovulum robiginosum]
MTDDPSLESDLDRMFRAARADAPEPSAALMARILADAEAERPRARQVVPRRRRRLRSAAMSALAGLGGWPALGGLATAGLAGLWIGYSAPAELETLTAGWLGTQGYDLVDLVPTADLYLQEG